MASRLRLKFSSLLLLVGTAAAALAIILLSRMIIETRESRAEFGENQSYYAAQMERELLNLIRVTYDIGYDIPGAKKDDLILRFDLFWSRLFDSTSVSGDQNFDVLRSAGRSLDDVRISLIELDDAIQKLNIGDTESAQRIILELDRMSSIVHDFAVSSVQHEAKLKNEKYTRQVLNARIAIGLLVTIIALTIGSTLRSRFDNRRVEEMVENLEDRVRKRTKSLDDSLRALEHEVSERRQIQADLEIREARLAQAAEIAGVGFYVWDPDKLRCLYVSERQAQMHGLLPSEYANLLEGQRYPVLDVLRDDFPIIENCIAELERGQKIDFEYRIEVEGEIRWIREIGNFWSCVASGDTRWIGTTIDITEQRELYERLLQTHELEVVGRLTGGIAHDFNNLLGVIIGNLEFIETCQNVADQAEYLAELEDAAYRAVSLTNQLLSYGRKAPLTPIDLDVKEVVMASVSLLKRLLPAQIQIQTEFDSNLLMLRADRSQLETALLNLGLNARDAMPNGGIVSICCRNVLISESGAYKDLDLEPGKYVSIAFSDDGLGIDESDLREIFTPYFTTKEFGQGSGLGLSMVSGFCKQSGGDIRIESAKHEGTTAYIVLPASSVTRSLSEANTITSAQGGAEILLIEDNPALLKIFERHLTDAGFKVTSFTRSETALGRLGSEYQPDLVLTDMVMPGKVQGSDLARTVREYFPNIPVIFVSGYPEGFEMDSVLDMQDVRFLQKPISKEDLLAAVSDAISRNRKKHLS